MVASNIAEVLASTDPKYDRRKELEAFDETKAGVKGLMDSGLNKLPRMFYQPIDSIDTIPDTSPKISIPIVDLEGFNNDPVKRSEIVNTVREASENLGFFQVVNHCVPDAALDGMLEGARAFFEQDTETKKGWYTRDANKRVVYNTNFDLFKAPAANWRDTFYCMMAPNPPTPDELPPPCRDVMYEFSKEIMKLGYLLCDILSEALGLKTNYLKDAGCAEGLAVLCHYYPQCPEPELALGTSRHTDNDFFTVLLQDHIGGLQVLHENQWLDVAPTPGALVVNVGDILQIMSNDKFLSVEHRVIAKNVGPRLSVAVFFSTGKLPYTKLYGPIEELTSDDNPPKYKPFTVKEYTDYVLDRGLDGTSPIMRYKIRD